MKGMILSIRPHASLTIENFSRSADLADLENPKSDHSGDEVGPGRRVN
jgi:hypothetical protein